MSLIACKECGNQISSGATSCPQCGAKRNSNSYLGILGIIFVILLVVMVMMMIDVSNDIASPPGRNEWQYANYALTNLTGTWHHADGIRSFTIVEAPADGRLDGRIIWSPPIGDWAAPLRCGISGSDLVVEIPAIGAGSRSVGKLFIIESASKLTGRFEPWDGPFTRY